MPTPAFKGGEIVQLKSGGPAMTVEGLNQGTGGWVCSWFVGSELKREQFRAEALKPYEPPPKKKLSASRPIA
jgi:uncharacterized protein YodC (DUF2158 family)